MVLVIKRDEIVGVSTPGINTYYSKTAPFPSMIGVGKPESLKENLAGFWSRGIDDTNRLVYVVDDNQKTIISCRYHYER
ncbi:MAG: hypothetical protein COB51_12760 [Moraxellaceae bacterium]|nr:MAG: hypothetical protein COB51_12760 [Moraxellaceae bacterium]